MIPAVFALGLEPTSGPGLIFATLPKVFAAIPAGAFFGCLFFVGLFGAGLSVGRRRVRGVGRRPHRQHAAHAIARGVGRCRPRSSSSRFRRRSTTRIFVPWDLTFGSGMQTLGSLVAVLTVGWCITRSAALRELGARGERRRRCGCTTGSGSAFRRSSAASECGGCCRACLGR